MVDSTNLDEYFEEVPAGDIDSEGKFKYVQIEVKLDDQVKYFVRGYKNCTYHADVFATFREELLTSNVISSFDGCQTGFLKGTNIQVAF